jgi:hypothetical protein
VRKPAEHAADEADRIAFEHAAIDAAAAGLLLDDAASACACRRGR